MIGMMGTGTHKSFPFDMLTYTVPLRQIPVGRATRYRVPKILKIKKFYPFHL